MSTRTYSSFSLTNYSISDTAMHQMYGAMKPIYNPGCFYMEDVPCHCSECKGHETWRIRICTCVAKGTHSECHICGSIEPECGPCMTLCEISYKDDPLALYKVDVDSHNTIIKKLILKTSSAKKFYKLRSLQQLFITSDTNKPVIRTSDVVSHTIVLPPKPKIVIDWCFIEGVPCDCEDCSDSNTTWRYFVRKTDSKKTIPSCPDCGSTEPYCCWEIQDGLTIQHSELSDALDFFKSSNDYIVSLADFDDHHVISRYFE
uniref:Uncharacterized protein n=1 Tax=viral metagenome TaxID=1070528 RepID=A0A6C0J6E9_9ZZZZ